MTDTPKDTLLTFPCDFTIKVFGQDSEEFEQTVMAILRKHQPALSENDVSSKLSGEGKYISLSIKLYVVSKAQLDEIYIELNANKLVLMTL